MCFCVGNLPHVFLRRDRGRPAALRRDREAPQHLFQEERALVPEVTEELRVERRHRDGRHPRRGSAWNRRPESSTNAAASAAARARAAAGSYGAFAEEPVIRYGRSPVATRAPYGPTSPSSSSSGSSKPKSR